MCFHVVHARHLALKGLDNYIVKKQKKQPPLVASIC